MARLESKAKANGFSLVELLIVVAIIGVLSTIGVPTFRRMVTKSKKSEARTALGGLFTVESAFFTEYNVYGNRLNKIGFELEGARRYYTVGFPTPACGLSPLAPPFGAPGTGTPGAQLAISFPTYFPPQGPQILPLAGNNWQGDTVYNRTTNGGATGTSRCYTTNVGVPAPYTTFVASATGHICPGCTDAGALDNVTAGRQDAWTLDQQRTIVNVIDGTN